MSASPRLPPTSSTAHRNRQDGSVTAYFGKIDGGQGSTSPSADRRRRARRPVTRFKVVMGDTATRSITAPAMRPASSRQRAAAPCRAGHAIAVDMAASILKTRRPVERERRFVWSPGDTKRRVGYGSDRGRYFNAHLEWNKNTARFDVQAKRRRKTRPQ